MVAITVVLAATVYVWVSGFASEGDGPEQASATAEGATVADSDVDWIRVSLTRGESAPYAEDQLSYTILAPNGDSLTPNPNADGDDALCINAVATSQTCDDDFHSDTNTNEWDVGDVLYVPCQGEGDHSVTISVRDTTVLDATIDCDTGA